MACNDLFSSSDDDDEHHAIDQYADELTISSVDVISCISLIIKGYFFRQIKKILLFHWLVILWAWALGTTVSVALAGLAFGLAMELVVLFE